MRIKKNIFLLLLIAVVMFCLIGCSSTNKSCYNNIVNSENYTKINSVQGIDFEVKKNNSTSLDKGVGAYFNKIGFKIEPKNTIEQDQVLWNLYVDGIFAEAKNGYALLDRESYIVFVINSDTSLNIGNIKNEQLLTEALNNATNNYFNFLSVEEKQKEFYKEYDNKKYKIISSLKAKIPFLKNTSLTGYASIMENNNKDCIIMITLTDKAFNSDTKKEMRYMVNSLVFNSNSLSTAEGLFEFTNTDFSITLNSQNMLFHTTQPIKPRQTDPLTKDPNSKYQFIFYDNVEINGNMYKVLSLNQGNSKKDGGFIYSTMDNLILSSGIYVLKELTPLFEALEENDSMEESEPTEEDSFKKQPDILRFLEFIEHRIMLRTNTFVSSLKISPETYTDVASDGVFVFRNSVYSIITYNLHREKEVHSCIEVYKEDITSDGHIVSYNISYKPLIVTSSNSAMAYNEILYEIGLRD